MSVRDYFIKSGDEYLVWVEAGSEPPPLQCEWNEADGHRWTWVGSQRLASRFTWAEARDVVWNKLKTLRWHLALGTKIDPPRTDRWAHKLVRIVPKGDKIRPAGRH